MAITNEQIQSAQARIMVFYHIAEFLLRQTQIVGTQEANLSEMQRKAFRREYDVLKNLLVTVTTNLLALPPGSLMPLTQQEIGLICTTLSGYQNPNEPRVAGASEVAAALDGLLTRVMALGLPDPDTGISFTLTPAQETAIQSRYTSLKQDLDNLLALLP